VRDPIPAVVVLIDLDSSATAVQLMGFDDRFCSSGRAGD
jgi:hypothetical protein